MRYPVSFAQRRLWALDRLVPGDPASHLCHATWLDGPVDPVALQRAMDAVVDRHAVLRTSVVAFDGEPEQVVDDTGRVLIDHVVLPGAAEDVERAESIAAELAVRPFDLARGPLLRSTVVEVGGDRWLFVVVAHRIVADDTAVAIVLDELSTVYRSGVAALSRTWMDYGDYAVWQRERLRGEELERQLDYWRAALRGVPENVALPNDSHRLTPSSRGGLVTAALDPTSLQLLADLALGVGAALSTAFLTGYAVVLSRYARQSDLVIGVPVSGRIRVELEPIVGPFADIVPVRVSLAGAPTFAQLLDRVRDAVERALAHDELPLDKLAEELGIDLPGNAVRFAFEHPPAPTLDLPGVAQESRVLLGRTAHADLDLTASADGTVTLGYRADLLAAPFVDWFLRSVVTVLELAGRTPDLPVADLPLPPPVEEGVIPAAQPAADNRVAPRDAVEETMARIWAELLRTTEPIGVHDSLFGLGGGSLTAVRFAARIADTYGVNLRLHNIFTAPTIAALAKIVSAELDPAPTGETAPAEETTRAGGTTRNGEAAHDTELGELSDDELDDLLRAVMATRDRRRTARGDAP